MKASADFSKADCARAALAAHGTRKAQAARQKVRVRTAIDIRVSFRRARFAPRRAAFSRLRERPFREAWAGLILLCGWSGRRGRRSGSLRLQDRSPTLSDP